LSEKLDFWAFLPCPYKGRTGEREIRNLEGGIRKNEECGNFWRLSLIDKFKRKGIKLSLSCRCLTLFPIRDIFLLISYFLFIFVDIFFEGVFNVYGVFEKRLNPTNFFPEVV